MDFQDIKSELVCKRCGKNQMVAGAIIFTRASHKTLCTECIEELLTGEKKLLNG